VFWWFDEPRDYDNSLLLGPGELFWVLLIPVWASDDNIVSKLINAPEVIPRRWTLKVEECVTLNSIFVFYTGHAVHLISRMQKTLQDKWNELNGKYGSIWNCEKCRSAAWFFHRLVVAMCTSKSAKQIIVFSPVRPSVCVCAISRKLLMRNGCNLVGIYVMVYSRSDKILMISDLDFRPWELWLHVR